MPGASFGSPLTRKSSGMSQVPEPMRAAASRAIVWPWTTTRGWSRTNCALRLPTVSVARGPAALHEPLRNAVSLSAATYEPPSSTTTRGNRPTEPEAFLSSIVSGRAAGAGSGNPPRSAMTSKKPKPRRRIAVLRVPDILATGLQGAKLLEASAASVLQDGDPDYGQDDSGDRDRRHALAEEEKTQRKREDGRGGGQHRGHRDP